MQRPLASVVFVLALCLGCGRERETAPPSARPIDDLAPRDGGTLVRRLDADIVTLNPVIANSRYDRYVDNYLFTPLVRMDKQLRPVPGLAKSWEISKDGLLYRFKLNPNATFSDGTRVRAADVLFTLRKIVDPASEALQVAGAFEFLDLTRSRVVDDDTIEVAFRESLATQLLRFNDVLVIPERVYSKGNFRNDYNSTAVGSGPYRLIRREAGKEIVLERRTDYWDHKPRIQTVVFKIINDHTTGWNALKRGDIDETLIATDTWHREHTNPALTSYIDFRRFYTLNYNFIAWNGRNRLFTDKNVRRALAMCIPIDVVVQDIYRGTARAMSGQFTPDEWAYNPNVPVLRYDPEGAKSVFASQGWKDTDGDGVLDKNGRDFEFDLTLFSGSQTGAQVCQLVQAELKKVGVKVNLQVME